MQAKNYDLRPSFSENYIQKQTALQKTLKASGKTNYKKSKKKTIGKNQFFQKTSFFKWLLAFITFVNYEHAYLAEKFLHILFSHFVFGKKEKRNKKKFVETVAVCRVLLDYNFVLQNKKSKNQLFRIYLPVKLVYSKMSIK